MSILQNLENAPDLATFESIAASYVWSDSDAPEIKIAIETLLNQIETFLADNAAGLITQSEFFIQRDAIRTAIAPLVAIEEKLPTDLKEGLVLLDTVVKSQVLIDEIVPTDLYESLFVFISDAFTAIDRYQIPFLSQIMDVSYFYTKYKPYLFGMGALLAAGMFYLVVRD